MNKQTRSELERNVRLLTVATALPNTLGLAVPFLVLFWQDRGLTFTHIMALQALYGVCTVLLEVPSGYFADCKGRRTALVYGGVFLSFGTFVYLLGSSWTIFCVAEVSFAIGQALWSGADTAILHDSLAAMGKADSYEYYDSKRRGVGNITAAVSGVVGGLLFLRYPNFTWALISFLCICSSFLALRLVEAPHKEEEVVPVHHSIAATMRYGWTKDRMFFWILLIGAVLAACNSSAFWMYQPTWKEAGISPLWFGVLFAGGNALCAFANLRAHRWGKSLSERDKLVMLCMVLAGSLVLGALLFGNLLVVFTVIGHQFVRGSAEVWSSAMLNRRFESSFRATLNSVVALLNRLGAVALALPVGYIVDHQGLVDAHLLLGIVVLSALALLVAPWSRLAAFKGRVRSRALSRNRNRF